MGDTGLKSAQLEAAEPVRRQTPDCGIPQEPTRLGGSPFLHPPSFFGNQDFHEGMIAFLANHTPEFRGRTQ